MTHQHHIDASRAQLSSVQNCGARRPRASHKPSLNELPSELHDLLLENIRSTGRGEQPPRQQPVLRLQSLRRMRSLLHAVLYFEVFLKQYADLVKEVDVLFPATSWDLHEYQDRSVHSPVLLRTIARSCASRLVTLRLPLYEFSGAETILPTVFEECKQLETLAFDDGGRVDERIGKLLGESTVTDLTVNRPSIHAITALRDGLHRLKTVRLCMVERELINDLRTLLKSSCLAKLVNLSIEFSERCRVTVDDRGADEHSDPNFNPRCNVMAFLEDLGVQLGQWLPLIRSLKLSLTSNHIGQSGAQLRKREVTAVNRMAASIVASRASLSGSRSTNGKRRTIHLSTTSSSQLQRIKYAMKDACRAADVRLDIDGYGVRVPMHPKQGHDESLNDYFVSRVNIRPVIITRVFGASEFPDEEYREFSKLEEVCIHFDKIMTHYSSQLWEFWRNCGTCVEKASMRCCAEKRREEPGMGTEEGDGDEQRRTERMNIMIFHMMVALKNLKILEITMCALGNTENNETVLPVWMQSVFQRGCLPQMRHLYFVVCECEGASDAFVRLCPSMLAMVCQLPSLESVHVSRDGRPSMQNIGSAQLDEAARGLHVLRERYENVCLGGVATALKEWRTSVQNAATL